MWLHFSWSHAAQRRARSVQCQRGLVGYAALPLSTSLPTHSLSGQLLYTGLTPRTSWQKIFPWPPNRGRSPSCWLIKLDCFCRPALWKQKWGLWRRVVQMKQKVCLEMVVKTNKSTCPDKRGSLLLVVWPLSFINNVPLDRVFTSYSLFLSIHGVGVRKITCWQYELACLLTSASHCSCCTLSTLDECLVNHLSVSWAVIIPYTCKQLCFHSFSHFVTDSNNWKVCLV